MTTRQFSNEEAPCLNEKGNHLDKSAAEIRFKKEGRLSRLSLLEKFLGLFLLVALVAVIVLIVILFRDRQDQGGENTSTNGNYLVTNPSKVCTTTKCVVAAARIHESLDPTVDPCQDFYQFSCGNWLKGRVIPEALSSLTTFELLRNEVTIILKNLLEAERKDSDPDFINKAKDLYASCLDTDTIERKGDEPLKNLLTQRLGGWPMVLESWDESSFDFVDLATRIWQLSSSAIFSFYAAVDSKDSTRRILMIDQTAYGMPGQKYFQVARNDSMLMAYQNLMHTMAVMMGAPNQTRALEDARAVVDFEIELSKINVRDEDRRDSNTLYNPMTLGQVHEAYKDAIDWRRFVTTLTNLDGVKVANITDDEVIINRSPSFFGNLTEVLNKTPKRVQANYMIWKVVIHLIVDLSEKYRHAYQQYVKALYGAGSARPRYETCSRYTVQSLGLAVGQLFIKDNFNDEAKSQAVEMIANLQTAFNELLEDVDWMDDEMKAVAREKNKHIKSKIGYPKEVTNNTYLQIYYENFTYSATDYFANVINNSVEGFKLRLRRLREPVDKDRWTTAPSIVNAYYGVSTNRIMFPAGIFQPPFFSATYPKSLNYGGIGMVIGHEITHGFDDRGRQYDKDGNLVQWWSESAIAKFKDKAQCIIDQYSNFTVKQVNMNLNGINTQGENIADNGGLKESFKAYRNWVASQGHEEAPLPGLNYTHNQLFFINFAQLWCTLMRDGSAISRIRTAVHSPGEFRVIGTVQNSPDFSEAFKCKPGSPMSRVDKCTIW